MNILGIETSCDDTSVAVLNIEKNKINILSSVVSSQVKLHSKYGGVVPHLAAREHEKNLPHVFKTALKNAKIKNPEKEIDFIVVTRGPGLSPALWRGVNFAKELSEKIKKPLIGANHLEGHIYSNWLSPNNNLKINDKKIFPALNLIVSGGHTELVLMKDYGNYKLIGETLDDASGEAFDKIARILGLGYPGGPAISAEAEKFSISNSQFLIKFPRPMIHSKDFNFSFSGLKTSVLYKVKNIKKDKIKLTSGLINEISYEAQEAIIDVLTSKTIKAAKKLKVKSILLSGGVSANKKLRERLGKESEKIKVKYFQPEMKFTMDNAAMITVAGYMNLKKNKKIAIKKVSVDANLKLK